jgi:hypothetical protein
VQGVLTFQNEENMVKLRKSLPATLKVMYVLYILCYVQSVVHVIKQVGSVTILEFGMFSVESGPGHQPSSIERIHTHYIVQLF